ncbi:MAG TPA: Holliday junction branch migration protein RuvA [Firmicutes bacterium]|jgi:Holliday junction DNA helicase RuvA|nr:Holliday junction branch migration protein RuvA [Bacillota bacterium]HHT42578.1 Holliday junction branch migration protein RuvA [Bacillota bacterium]
MIVSLKGRLLDAADSIVFLEVQGVGFEVNASASVLKSLPPLGQELQVFTYLQVREDNMALYGFSSWEERRLFEKIISVAGIGPKSGLAIISSIDPEGFIRAVQTQDLKTLTTLPGVGKKTGQRILLELKDAFKHVELPESHEDAPDLPGDIVEDALEALIALGYSSSEAQRMVDLAQPQLDQQYDLQELLKTALAQNSQQRGERTWKRNG